MKFLFLSIVVIAAVAYFYFFGNPNRPIDFPVNIIPANNETPSSTAPHKNQTPSLNKNSSGTRNSAPPGFKGPTGPPHIIGPSGPPPNY